MSISDLQELQQLATDAEAQQLDNAGTVPNATTNAALDLSGLGSLLGGLTSSLQPVTGSLLGGSSPVAGVASTVAGVAQQVNSVLMPLVQGILSSAISTAAGVPLVGPTIAGLAGGLDLNGALNQVGQLEGSLLSGLFGQTGGAP